MTLTGQAGNSGLCFFQHGPTPVPASKEADDDRKQPTPSIKTNVISIGHLTHNKIETVKRINRAALPLHYSSSFYKVVVDNRELARIAFACDIPVGALCCMLKFTGEGTTEHKADDAFFQTEPEGAFSLDNATLVPSRHAEWCITSSRVPIVTKKSQAPTSPIPKTPKKPNATSSLPGTPGSPACAEMYILTLAVLAPFRRCGIGRKLIEWIQTLCREINAGQVKETIGHIPGYQAPQSGNPSVIVNELTCHVWTADRAALEFYRAMGFAMKDECPGYYPLLDPPDAVKLHLHLRS